MTLIWVEFKSKHLLLLCTLIGLCGLALASWDSPVVSIDREETIQEANEEAASAKNDVSQIDQNRVDEEKATIEKRDPHEGHNFSSSVLTFNLLCLIPFSIMLLRRI
ncbi:hypothetical protein M3Y97_00555800 [Aphelenchoides bicaudatus]|nr:hypothetical protein M3Y97_00555800 [Aphelenchoides bicaudatus]